MEPSKTLTVCVTPLIVTVLVPFVKVELAPEVSHDPDTVHDPDVNVIELALPLVIVTFPTVTVAWFALTAPPAFTVNAFVPKANIPVLPATSVRVPVTETAPSAVIVPVVILNVVLAPIVTAPRVNEDVVPVMPPVPTRDTVAVPEMARLAVVSVPAPEVDKVPNTSIALDSVIVPETVRL